MSWIDKVKPKPEDHPVYKPSIEEAVNALKVNGIYAKQMDITYTANEWPEGTITVSASQVSQLIDFMQAWNKKF